jgi:hypothetical protein
MINKKPSNNPKDTPSVKPSKRKRSSRKPSSPLLIPALEKKNLGSLASKMQSKKPSKKLS